MRGREWYELKRQIVRDAARLISKHQHWFETAPWCVLGKRFHIKDTGKPHPQFTFSLCGNHNPMRPRVSFNNTSVSDMCVRCMEAYVRSLKSKEMEV